MFEDFIEIPLIKNDNFVTDTFSKRKIIFEEIKKQGQRSAHE